MLSFMTLLSTAQHIARDTRKHPRSHIVLIMVGGDASPPARLRWSPICCGRPGARRLADAPARLPVSVGGTLFNVPTAAIRMKIQRHSGPQERVDLSFIFPSLEPPEAPKHVSADTVEEKRAADRPDLPVDRGASRHAGAGRARAHDLSALSRASLDAGRRRTDDARVSRRHALRNEDLFFASAPSLNARCTRDGATPGMCLSERRIDGADLTFRFPRSWLAQWRDVADAMDRLTAQLHGPRDRTSARSDSALKSCSRYDGALERVHAASALLDQIVLEDRHLELE